MGGASRAPIGGLGQVPGTAAYGWGGAQSGMQGYAPTYGGGYLGNVGDSRTFSALSPSSQAYMQAGSPGSYASWLQGGGAGGGGGGGGGGMPRGLSLEEMLAMMFQQQQQKRPDYSALFMSPQIQLEGPATMTPQAQPGSSGRPRFTNTPQYDFGGYI
jgi:hypothetical protein